MQITLSDSRQRNRAKPQLKRAYVNYQHKIAIQKQEQSGAQEKTGFNEAIKSLFMVK